MQEFQKGLLNKGKTLNQETSNISNYLQWQGGGFDPFRKKYESKLESSPIFGVKRKHKFKKESTT